MNRLNESVSHRIDTLRKERGWSWEQLAYGAGISKGGLSEIKNALVEARLSTLCRIALAFGITPSKLLDFDIDMSEIEKSF